MPFQGAMASLLGAYQETEDEPFKTQLSISETSCVKMGESGNKSKRVNLQLG